MADFTFVTPGATVDLPEGSQSAFGLLKTAHEDTVLALSFPYNVNTEHVTATTANGGTVTHANAHAVLQTSAANNGQAAITSRGAVRYTPGQGVVARFTAVFASGGKASSWQRVGFGDSAFEDGFFFGFDGTAFGIWHINAGVATHIPTASWNGDACAWLDTTLGNVYMISYQWLGYGYIRFYIESPSTGARVLVHTIRYPNTSALTSLRYATLPFHAEARNVGNTSNLQIAIPSVGAAIEGPANYQGTLGSALATKTGVTTLAAILTLKSVTTYATRTNRVRAKIIQLAFAANKDVSLYLVRNATLGGSPSYANFDVNTSTLQTDTAGTTVTGGRTLWTAALEANARLTLPCDFLDLRINPGETLTLAALNPTASGAQVQASITWREEF